MSEMVEIDGVRYRIEDAPKVKQVVPANKAVEPENKGATNAGSGSGARRRRVAAAADPK